MKRFALETRVGFFVVAALVVAAYATLRVSDRGFQGGGYSVYVTLDSAEGLTRKTPVEIAGIQVGYIDSLELVDGRRARARLKLDRQVILGNNAKAQVRSKGFLGETYIDVLPGDLSTGQIPSSGEIRATNPYVYLGLIASDMREVTDSLKKILAYQPDAPLYNILKNMEHFTAALNQNTQNVDQIMSNMARFSGDLRGLMAERKEGLRETMERVNNIVRKVDEGRGTIGRLMNDDEMVENINEAAKGLSETVGGLNRFQLEVDYHTEYLTETKDFKNYVELGLRPRPDKAFLIGFVVDPSPSPTETVTDTVVTTGGTSTTVTTDRNEVDKNKFLVSAELAKTFHDFTLRGGLIESRGGVGLDYRYGPVGIDFSAFDFRTDHNQRPHLKALARLNVTKNFYVVSGVDDFISKQQDPDWFVGAGLHLIDDDIRSLFGAASLAGGGK